MSSYRREYDDDFFLSLADQLDLRALDVGALADEVGFIYADVIMVRWWPKKMKLQLKARSVEARNWDPCKLLMLANDALESAFSDQTNNDVCEMVAIFGSGEHKGEPGIMFAEVKIRDYLS